MLSLKPAVAALVIGLAVTGGGSLAAPAVPANPTRVTTPDEYSFGDAVQSRDWHATKWVLDALEARFGVKSMTVFTRNLAGDADPTVIRHYYKAALPGWTAMDVGEDSRGQSWAFALVSPDGGKALAVVALKPEGPVAGEKVPMNIITNLAAAP